MDFEPLGRNPRFFSFLPGSVPSRSFKSSRQSRCQLTYSWQPCHQPPETGRQLPGSFERRQRGKADCAVLTGPIVSGPSAHCDSTVSFVRRVCARAPRDPRELRVMAIALQRRSESGGPRHQAERGTGDRRRQSCRSRSSTRRPTRRCGRR